MTARIWDHRSKQDLRGLETALGTLSAQQKSLAILFALRAGLMQAKWPIKAALKFIWLIHGPVQGTARAATGMVSGFPKMVDELWTDLMRQMIDGRNLDDRTSAGAWNRRELQQFLFIVDQLGWRAPGEVESAELPPSH